MTEEKERLRILEMIDISGPVMYYSDLIWSTSGVELSLRRNEG